MQPRVAAGGVQHKAGGRACQCTDARRAGFTDVVNGGWTWRGAGGARLAAALNGSAHAVQCLLRRPWADRAGRARCFVDLMGPAAYDRAADELPARGLFFDLPGWGHHLFALRPS
jgi:hypothetical protein